MSEKPSSLAYVSASAIIEREVEGRIEVLLQERFRKERRSLYEGRFEIPGGRLNIGEDPITGLKREVEEECGLQITEIWPSWIEETEDAGKRSIVFHPFVCEGSIGAYCLGFVWVCKAVGSLRKEGLVDARNPRWVPFDELAVQLEKQPELFTPYHLASLRYYVSERRAGRIWIDKQK